MAVWLYQMSNTEWPHQQYRAQVWEGNSTTWDVRNRRPTSPLPQLGDMLVLFYAPFGATDPGVYGWAVVLGYDERSKSVFFRPSTPSDYLKMNPLWDDEVKNIASRIRGKMAQANMFLVEDGDWTLLRQKIAAHLQGVYRP